MLEQSEPARRSAAASPHRRRRRQGRPRRRRRRREHAATRAPPLRKRAARSPQARAPGERLAVDRIMHDPEADGLVREPHGAVARSAVRRSKDMAEMAANAARGTAQAKPSVKSRLKDGERDDRQSRSGGLRRKGECGHGRSPSVKSMASPSLGLVVAALWRGRREFGSGCDQELANLVAERSMGSGSVRPNHRARSLSQSARRDQSGSGRKRSVSPSRNGLGREHGHLLLAARR